MIYKLTGGWIHIDLGIVTRYGQSVLSECVISKRSVGSSKRK